MWPLVSAVAFLLRVLLWEGRRYLAQLLGLGAEGPACYSSWTAWHWVCQACLEPGTIGLVPPVLTSNLPVKPTLPLWDSTFFTWAFE